MLRHGAKVVEVRDATPGQAFSCTELDLLGNSAAMARDLYGEHAVEVLVRSVAREQEDRASPDRLRQLGPPDLVLLHRATRRCARGRLALVTRAARRTGRTFTGCTASVGDAHSPGSNVAGSSGHLS